MNEDATTIRWNELEWSHEHLFELRDWLHDPRARHFRRIYESMMHALATDTIDNPACNETAFRQSQGARLRLRELMEHTPAELAALCSDLAGK